MGDRLAEMKKVPQDEPTMWLIAEVERLRSRGLLNACRDAGLEQAAKIVIKYFKDDPQVGEYIAAAIRREIKGRDETR